MKILLTGGASGLGLDLFEKLSSAGHSVIFTYNGSLEQADKNLINSPNSRKFHCNFKDSQSVEKFVSQIVEFDIDVLINNALPMINGTQFQKTQINSLSDSFNWNVIPVLKITQACIAHFRKKKSGRIITILTSYLVNKPPIGYSEYVANKAYLHSMSKTWANENAKFGIVSNCILPSIMRTPLNKSVDERLLENMENANPLGRLLTTSEVSEIVEFLVASPLHLNGCNLLINGGENVI